MMRLTHVALWGWREACCLTALTSADVVQRRRRTNGTAVWSNGGKALREAMVER